MTTYAFIPVQRRSLVETYAWIDADLYDELSQYRWGFNGNYAFSAAVGLMHRLIAGVPGSDSRVVHHRNEDHLDNRRENLTVYSGVVEHGRVRHPRRNAIAAAARLGAAPELPVHARVLALQKAAA